MGPDPGGSRLCATNPFLMAAARIQPDPPGVYRYFVLIDDRPAFFLVDWRGIEYPVRVVGDHETEAEVIAELEAQMGPRPTHSRTGRRERPPLFLL